MPHDPDSGEQVKLGQYFIGHLSRYFFPFGLRDIGIEEYVSILLVQGQGVDVDYLLRVDKVLQNPSQALEEATVDHDDLAGLCQTNANQVEIANLGSR